ncbi:Uncharacterised protein [uncultured archaeon]|nr:Uncharacterised protein [uncultured archaeon]
MKVPLLGIVMISSLLLVASSAYLDKVVFADDSWSSITQRAQQAATNAAMVYDNKYQFNNVPQSTRSYVGLSFVTTDSSTTGRDISGASITSMANALAAFDQSHARLLSYTLGTGYADLNSTTTDSSGRNRNAMIAEGRDSIDQQVANLIIQLGKLNDAYVNSPTVATTTGYVTNVQGQINDALIAQEIQSATLINQIWQIDQQFMNLQSYGTTDSTTQGRQIAAAQEAALTKAVQIFNEIHAHTLARTYGGQYAGLSSVTTGQLSPGQPGYGMSYGDRHSQIDFSTEMALQNAINFFNSYYPNTPISLPNYSH